MEPDDFEVRGFYLVSVFRDVIRSQPFPGILPDPAWGDFNALHAQLPQERELRLMMMGRQGDI